jgi:bifunctional DNA-binding transcriptional regulator/antitoxin component of YhaV-PrlF toxin-antitoxin module
MGYESTVQVIQRGGKNRQWYLICPAPLAQALEIAKGEVIEWVVEDKHTLVLKRAARRAEGSSLRRRSHEG